MLHETGGSQVGVPHGGRDVGVAHPLLDHLKGHPTLYQVGCTGMATGVEDERLILNKPNASSQGSPTVVYLSDGGAIAES